MFAHGSGLCGHLLSLQDPLSTTLLSLLGTSLDQVSFHKGSHLLRSSDYSP